ncbi:MAG: helix-hairpin-helix domain-containing protein [Thermodesulfobacteriota bacterium]
MIKGPVFSNDEIADTLERISSLLEVQGAGTYRVRAYLYAAQTVRDSRILLSRIVSSEGVKGLESLPGIGKSIAAVISELLSTGRIGLLERLEGQVSPEELFETVPGIGVKTAHEIHKTLGIETLEELEIAAHDGSLLRVPGLGRRKVQGIKDALSGILSRSSRRRTRRLRWLEHEMRELDLHNPDIELILEADKEYREKATRGELKKIAPKRFNPSGERWLPIYHKEKEGWSFTVLYSNSPLAHKLGRLRDWVIVYYEKDGEEDQCTVVTEWQGRLSGRRVIRGRETECLDYYSRRRSENVYSRN